MRFHRSPYPLKELTFYLKATNGGSIPCVVFVLSGLSLEYWTSEGTQRGVLLWQCTEDILEESHMREWGRGSLVQKNTLWGPEVGLSVASGLIRRLRWAEIVQCQFSGSTLIGLIYQPIHGEVKVIEVAWSEGDLQRCRWNRKWRWRAE